MRLPLTVATVAFCSGAAFVMRREKNAMIGMPTPYSAPSSLSSLMCTFFGGGPWCVGRGAGVLVDGSVLLGVVGVLLLRGAVGLGLPAAAGRAAVQPDA